MRDIDPPTVCAKCGDEFHGDGDYCDECANEEIAWRTKDQIGRASCRERV